MSLMIDRPQRLTGFIVRLFERDARQQVLWFSGPPLAPGTIHVPSQTAHSLEYLAYLTKRKRGQTRDDPSKPSESGRRKGARYDVAASRDETALGSVGEAKTDFRQSWWAQGMSVEQVARGLRAVIGGV